jgi:hypothetical protein
MKFIAILLSGLFCALSTLAQNAKEYKSIDERALQMPDSLTHSTAAMARYIKVNFATQTEKARAIFIWVTTNIRYDVENMYAINFYEKNEDKISKAIHLRKGNCANYAALFTDICQKSGLKSFVVDGYTIQHREVDALAHGWNVVLIDNEWFMFDPTWGSGYVSKGKFKAEINNKFFKVAPSEFIKTHMPFDYLWQCLEYPITADDFYEGKFDGKDRPLFKYRDSIKVYEGQTDIQRTIAAARRIEKNGVKNSLIFDRLHHLREEVEVYKQNQNVTLFNSASADFNEGVSAYNTFIDYRNRQFTPVRPDVEIQAMLSVAHNKLIAARTKIEMIREPNESISGLMGSSLKLINETLLQVKEQQDFLNKYFTKNKADRREMFYVPRK